MIYRYISVSAEQAPWSRSGGLAEVTGSLPKALQQYWIDHRDHSAYDKIEIHCVSPLYPCVWRELNRQGQRLTPIAEISLEPLCKLNAQIWILDEPTETDSEVTLSHVFVDIPWAFDREHFYGPPG